MDDFALRAVVDQMTPCCPVTPIPKNHMMRVPDVCGHVVGLPGDGINGAPVTLFPPLQRYGQSGPPGLPPPV